MMLIPVCIEKLSEVPSYISTVQLTEAYEDYEDHAKELAKSVVEWLNLTAEKRPSLFTVQVKYSSHTCLTHYDNEIVIYMAFFKL